MYTAFPNTTAYTGGSAILGYDLWRDDGNNGDFFDLYAASNVLALSYLDLNVTSGTVYRYKYRASNINGWGDFSDIGYLFAANAPSQPPAPQLMAVNSTTIQL